MLSNLTHRGWFVVGGICTFVVMIGLTAVVLLILLITSSVQHSVSRYNSGYYHGYRNTHSSYRHYHTHP